MTPSNTTAIKEQRTLHDIQTIRERHHENRAPDRLLYFIEQDKTIRVTYNDSLKETISTDQDGTQCATVEPISISDKQELDAFYDAVQDYDESISPSSQEHSREDGFDLER